MKWDKFLNRPKRLSMIPQWHRISKNFQIRIAPQSSALMLTQEQHKKVDQIWEEQQRNTHLFNGHLFSVKSLDDDAIIGEWIEYKYMIAQRYDPALRQLLKITSLGISSVTTCADAILVGRRGKTMANYPNLYECAPSGGIDPSTVKGDQVDAATLILKELEEEVGLTAKDTRSIKFSKIYCDPANLAYDLIASIELAPEAKEKIVPTVEYPEVFWLERSEIIPFLKQHKEAIIPLTQVLLMGEHI